MDEDPATAMDCGNASVDLHGMDLRSSASTRERRKTPEAPFELFRDWQRTQTQSSVTAARPETANGCPVLRRQEPRREAHMRATSPGIGVLRAPLKRASGELRFLLTKDLHGCLLSRRQAQATHVLKITQNKHPGIRRSPVQAPACSEACNSTYGYCSRQCQSNTSPLPRYTDNAIVILCLSR